MRADAHLRARTADIDRAAVPRSERAVDPEKRFFFPGNDVHLDSARLFDARAEIAAVSCRAHGGRCKC